MQRCVIFEAMNKKAIVIIIILLSISLLGIIGLQFYWINGAITLHEQQFDSQVQEAMSVVVEKLQADEAFSFMPGTEMANMEKMNQQIQALQDSIGNNGNISLKKNPDKNGFSGGFSITQSVNGHDTFFVSRGDNNGLAYQQEKAARLSDVMNKLMLSYMQKNMDIHHRINPGKLDQMLQEEFRNRSIDIPYSFAVMNGSENKPLIVKNVADFKGITGSRYRVGLFPYDFVPQNNFLIVDFPQKGIYLLRAMGLILSASALFLIVIIICFIYVIRVIFTQKKISDIKNDFINNMTHEFKTPIATISLATDAINNPKILADTAKLKYYTGIIKEENIRMNSQVEKVLQIALLDKDDFKLQLQPLDMHEIILKAINHFTLQVNERGGTIESSLTAMDFIIMGDEVHMANVIYNLLDNANKYSPETPEISVRTWNEKNRLIIEVGDKGLGMTKETQKKVFDKFYRVSSGNLHTVKGFGLGLSYVKAILLEHHADIHIESELNKGSRFIISLPIYIEQINN